MVGGKLTPQQVAFGEWLALSPWERSPATQKEMAVKLGVTARTLQLWAKIPQIRELVNKLYADKLIALVGPATALLEQAIKKPGGVSRVSFDCAKYIVQDWAKKYQGGGNVVKSIADLYQKYHPNDSLESN